MCHESSIALFNVGLAQPPAGSLHCHSHSPTLLPTLPPLLLVSSSSPAPSSCFYRGDRFLSFSPTGGPKPRLNPCSDASARFVSFVAVVSSSYSSSSSPSAFFATVLVALKRAPLDGGLGRLCVR